MSQEQNLAIAQRYVAAVNARDIPDKLFAPGFVLKNAVTAVTDATYEGVEGQRQWIRDMYEVLDDEDARWEAEPVEVSDAYVVGKCRIVGTARSSGMPFDFPYWGVLWIEDGRITRAVGYLTRADALEAVGLSE